MKNVFQAVLAVGLVLSLSQLAFAAQSGAQVGAPDVAGDGIQNAVQDEDIGVSSDSGQQNEDPTNEIAGDGIPNRTQDEEYGSYGSGESPNEISGDGIPNRTQDEEYGHYGEEAESGMAEPALIMNNETGKREQAQLGELVRVLYQEQAVTTSDEGADAVPTLYAGSGASQQKARLANLADEIVSSLEEMTEAESQIKERSGFTRFFMGGDDETAEKITQLKNENQNKIQEMNQVLTSCGEDCDGEVKVQLENQLQLIEQEQERLNAVAEKEMSKKGLFGWMFGWLG